MTLMETMDALIAEGYVPKRNGKMIKFNIKATDTPIENLDLPTRAYNGLRRAGCVRIEDVIDIINRGDVALIPSCGKKSIKEIENRILEWHWSMLNPIGQAAFIKEIFI